MPGATLIEKQPVPGIGLGDPAADDRSDRRCQHRKHAGNRRCDALRPRWKEQEDRGEHGRDERAAGKALDDAPGDQLGKARARGTAEGGQR